MKSTRLASFVLGLFVALLISEGVARQAVSSSDAPVLRWHDFASQLKAEQMDEIGDVELVVIGTSMAQQDLIPANLLHGASVRFAYNAGLNGGVPVVMEPWLQDQVLPRLNPQTVLWGLSPLDLSAVYGDATKNAYDQAFESRSGILAGADRFGSRFSTLVASRAVLRDPSKLFGDEATVRATQYTEATASLGAAGERIVYDIELGVERQQEMSGRVTPYRIDREDLAAIARTVRLLNEQGIEVVFVELPVPNRFVSLLPNQEQDMQLFSSAVQSLGRELDVRVLSPTIALVDDDFVDFTHLNIQAALRLSTDIGAQLAGS